MRSPAGSVHAGSSRTTPPNVNEIIPALDGDNAEQWKEFDNAARAAATRPPHIAAPMRDVDRATRGADIDLAAARRHVNDEGAIRPPVQVPAEPQALGGRNTIRNNDKATRPGKAVTATTGRPGALAAISDQATVATAEPPLALRRRRQTLAEGTIAPSDQSGATTRPTSRATTNRDQVGSPAECTGLRGQPLIDKH